MKRLTLEQWEDKYISGPIERFNQKNTMFMRVAWDESIKSKLDNWSFTGETKDKPGYTLQDLSFRWAVRHGVNMLFCVCTIFIDRARCLFYVCNMEFE